MYLATDFLREVSLKYPEFRNINHNTGNLHPYANRDAISAELQMVHAELQMVRRSSLSEPFSFFLAFLRLSHSLRPIREN